MGYTRISVAASRISFSTRATIALCCGFDKVAASAAETGTSPTLNGFNKLVRAVFDYVDSAGDSRGAFVEFLCG
jgi:hypothetical protein